MSLLNIEAEKAQEIRETLLVWGKNNYRDYPWRKTSNKFHAIVAEIMLQRTRADQVLKVYNRFVNRFVTPDDVCNDSTDNVYEILQPLGLNWRTKKIIDFSSQLCKLGSVPDSMEELTKLSGIGQYAACAFLSLHSNQKCSLIDANTVRVWGRIFGFKTDAETRRNKMFRELADSVTPDIYFKEFNYAVLDFSNIVCKTKPLCEICPINKMCYYFKDSFLDKR